MKEPIEFSVKAAIAIKSARTALGISQAELSQQVGIAKTTLARIETLEAAVKIDTYFKLLEVFKEKGIIIDVQQHQDIHLTITDKAQSLLIATLADDSNRRSDKNGKRVTEPKDAHQDHAP